MPSDDVAQREQPVPAHLRRADLENETRTRAIEIERDWTARRLTTFRELESAAQQTTGTVNDAIGNVLRVAARVLDSVAEARQEMEQEARTVVDQLHRERGRLVEEIQDRRRERDDLTNELAAMRRRAEEEAAKIRETAERERDAVLQDAEQRRSSLMEEVADLEEQIAQVSTQLQSLLGRAPAAPQRGSRATGGGAPAAIPQSRGTTEPPRSDSNPGATAEQNRSAVQTAAPTVAAEPRASPPSGNASAAPVGATPPAPEAKNAATAEPSSTPSSTTDGGPTDQKSAGGQSSDGTPKEVPTFVRRVPSNVTADGAAAGPGSERDPSGLVRARVTIQNVPGFPQALGLQRGLQDADGVTQVQALQFEQGTLILSVEHRPDVDVAEVVERLPGPKLDLIGRDSGLIELRFPIGSGR